MTATADGNRTAEFRHLSEAVALGIPFEELHPSNLQVRRRKRRKVAPAAAAPWPPVGTSSGTTTTCSGADRRPLLVGRTDADGNDVPPVALNFLGDLMPARNSTTSIAAAARHDNNNTAATSTCRGERNDTASAASPPEEIEATHEDDPWSANARRLDASIAQMLDVLRRQEAEYVDLCGSLRGVRLGANNATGAADADANAAASVMTDAERNALDAAVASFAVSTGNQIEALRQALASATGQTADDPGRGAGGDLAAHRVGIVACLVSSLRTDVVDRMGRMHAVRMRPTLDLARDPLQCRLGRAGDDGDHADGDATTARLENLLGIIRAAPEPSPSEAASSNFQEEEDFYAKYCQEGEEQLLKEAAMPLPSFPRADGASIDLDRGGSEHEQSTSPRPLRSNSSSAKVRPRKAAGELEVVPLDLSVQQYYGESTAEQEAFIEDLQRESAYLTASLQNELEDVHKIENKMMEITTLLRQFGDMVAEQQEDIVAIHDQAAKSKKNVQAGQNNLVDAGDRKKKSKHYMATFIASLGLLLLFLNWIIP